MSMHLHLIGKQIKFPNFLDCYLNSKIINDDKGPSFLSLMAQVSYVKTMSDVSEYKTFPCMPYRLQHALVSE